MKDWSLLKKVEIARTGQNLEMIHKMAQLKDWKNILQVSGFPQNHKQIKRRNQASWLEIFRNNQYWFIKN